MIEVILNVVVGAVHGCTPPRGSPAENGHIAHDVLKGRLHFLGPFGGMAPPIRGRDGVLTGEAALAKPGQEFWAAVRDEVLGHVVDTSSFVEREGPNASGVESGMARATALRRAPPPVRLKLPCRGSLPVEVHGGVREGREGAVPLVPLKPVNLRHHGLKAERERRQVRNEHELQLDVSVDPSTEEEMGNQCLVGVVLQAAPHLVPANDLQGWLADRGNDTARAAV